MRESSPSRGDRKKSRRLSTCYSRQSGKIPHRLEADLDVEEEEDIESTEVSHKPHFKGHTMHYFN